MHEILYLAYANTHCAQSLTINDVRKQHEAQLSLRYRTSAAHYTGG